MAISMSALTTGFLRRVQGGALLGGSCLDAWLWTDHGLHLAWAIVRWGHCWQCAAGALEVPQNTWRLWCPCCGLQLLLLGATGRLALWDGVRRRALRPGAAKRVLGRRVRLGACPFQRLFAVLCLVAHLCSDLCRRPCPVLLGEVPHLLECLLRLAELLGLAVEWVPLEGPGRALLCITRAA